MYHQRYSANVCLPKVGAGWIKQKKPGLFRAFFVDRLADYEQPLVLPHVSHFSQVPLRTMVKF